jgi:hypothetical protein
MLGIDRPPVAITTDGTAIAPSAVCTTKPSSTWATPSTLHEVSIRTPAASHSSSNIRTICFDESSQNNCPSSFS